MCCRLLPHSHQGKKLFKNRRITLLVINICDVLSSRVSFLGTCSRFGTIGPVLVWTRQSPSFSVSDNICVVVSSGWTSWINPADPPQPDFRWFQRFFLFAPVWACLILSSRLQPWHCLGGLLCAIQEGMIRARYAVPQIILVELSSTRAVTNNPLESLCKVNCMSGCILHRMAVSACAEDRRTMLRNEVLCASSYYKPWIHR
jgi:hypothetical protein